MIRPLLKICGLTTPDDARLCYGAGADLLGVIFADSPRQVDVPAALEIRHAVPLGRLVGVFGDCRVDEVASVTAATGLDMVQLHDCGDPQRWEAVARAAGVPVLPAVTADQAEAAAADMLARDRLRLAGLLLDLPKSGHVPADLDPVEHRRALWSIARRCGQDGVRVMLAGSLDADNVTAAVAAAVPYGLDVCRGVEASPGVKDPDEVHRLVDTVRTLEVDHGR